MKALWAERTYIAGASVGCRIESFGMLYRNIELSIYHIEGVLTSFPWHLRFFTLILSEKFRYIGYRNRIYPPWYIRSDLSLLGIVLNSMPVLISVASSRRASSQCRYICYRVLWCVVSSALRVSVKGGVAFRQRLCDRKSIQMFTLYFLVCFCTASLVQHFPCFLSQISVLLSCEKVG